MSAPAEDEILVRAHNENGVLTVGLEAVGIVAVISWDPSLTDANDFLTVVEAMPESVSEVLQKLIKQARSHREAADAPEPETVH
jgi:hypothetical protein